MNTFRVQAARRAEYERCANIGTADYIAMAYEPASLVLTGIDTTTHSTPYAALGTGLRGVAFALKLDANASILCLVGDEPAEHPMRPLADFLLRFALESLAVANVAYVADDEQSHAVVDSPIDDRMADLVADVSNLAVYCRTDFVPSLLQALPHSRLFGALGLQRPNLRLLLVAPLDGGSKLPCRDDRCIFVCRYDCRVNFSHIHTSDIGSWDKRHSKTIIDDQMPLVERPFQGKDQSRFEYLGAFNHCEGYADLNWTQTSCSGQKSDAIAKADARVLPYRRAVSLATIWESGTAIFSPIDSRRFASLVEGLLCCIARMSMQYRAIVKRIVQTLSLALGNPLTLSAVYAPVPHHRERVDTPRFQVQGIEIRLWRRGPKDVGTNHLRLDFVRQYSVGWSPARHYPLYWQNRILSTWMACDARSHTFAATA